MISLIVALIVVSVGLWAIYMVILAVEELFV